jgi:hypothetical protein
MESSNQPYEQSAAPIDPSAGSQAGGQGIRTSAASAGAESDPESAGGRDLSELRARVAALEAEQARLLAGYATSLETEVARLRSIGPQVTPGEAAERRGKPLTPPYLGRALVAIEDHLADMETFAAAGNYEAARQSKLAAAARGCSTLRRLCDDDDFHKVLMTMQEQLTQLGGQEKSISDWISGTSPSFRDLEVELLELAGLPLVLAQTHVDQAIAAFQADQTAAYNLMRNPMKFLGDLRQLRDLSCQTADLLSQGIHREQSRRRWKKILTFGLGGTLIVVVNGISTAVLGPIGVAASGAMGSAAVGVAAQLVS